MLQPTSDLASHFLQCGNLGANLTLAPGERMVITDDILRGAITDRTAFGMAAVVARDDMVGQAALLPLGRFAMRMSGGRREKFERLFTLIEESAFSPVVRGVAQTMLQARSLEAEVTALSHELGGIINPARLRYRQFLDVIKALIYRKISRDSFNDEFADFTKTVAGKLDFGIYALCVDRLFISKNIPMEIKGDLFAQILTFPPLIRKELVTNLLSSPTAPAKLVTHAQRELAIILTRQQLTEIMLFTTLKLSWAAQKDRAAKASVQAA
jgi:hypothetical protein